jgi:hypothetical protein
VGLEIPAVDDAVLGRVEERALVRGEVHPVGALDAVGPVLLGQARALEVPDLDVRAPLQPRVDRLAVLAEIGHALALLEERLERERAGEHREAVPVRVARARAAEDVRLAGRVLCAVVEVRSGPVGHRVAGGVHEVEPDGVFVGGRELVAVDVEDGAAARVDQAVADAAVRRVPVERLLQPVGGHVAVHPEVAVGVAHEEAVVAEHHRLGQLVHVEPDLPAHVLGPIAVVEVQRGVRAVGRRRARDAIGAAREVGRAEIARPPVDRAARGLVRRERRLARVRLSRHAAPHARIRLSRDL